MIVRDFWDLLALPAALADAVAEGRDAFDVEFPSGAVFGADTRERVRGGVLVLDAGDLGLRVRVAGGAAPAVLACTGVAIVARRVSCEGLAIVGATGTALSVAAREKVALRDVAVLGARPDDPVLDPAGDGAVVVAGAPEVVLDGVTIARSQAPRALLLIAPGAGSVRISASTLAGEASAAVLTQTRPREVVLTGTRVLAPVNGPALSLPWPPEGRFEVRDGVLAAPPERVLSLRDGADPGAPPLSLQGATVLAGDPGALPPLVSAGSGVAAGAAGELEEAVEDAVRVAAVRLLEVDERLLAHILPPG